MTVRILTACLAVSLVPTFAAADDLKPKFGDIDGVYYTDVGYDRAACRQAVKNKIALCRQNTGFISNTENRSFPGCLPIFREQSRVCADHFRSEAYKCEGSGPARIADFTGFGCTVTETVVEGDGPVAMLRAADGADPWADDSSVTVGEMKPKFGDIDGVYYTDVAYDREACRQAVSNKIALCRQNTGFISNTENRQFPGCLPIFREQSRVCADHFRSEAYKCEGSGPARIEDFTGFSCTVTETAIEGGGEGETWGTEDAADPWADDYGTAADDPWAPDAAEDDPWAWDDAPAPASSGADAPLSGRDRAGPEADDFDYNAALRALDGAGGMDRRALPEDDYSAKLQELERREAERREAEIAREAERQAERRRQEVAERRARQEAEEASRRAALEREAEETWRVPDDSYETYESEPSNDTLFGGGEAGQQAFEETLQEVLEQRRAAEERSSQSGWQPGMHCDLTSADACR